MSLGVKEKILDIHTCKQNRQFPRIDSFSIVTSVLKDASAKVMQTLSCEV